MNTRRSKRSREPDANSDKALQPSKKLACAGPSTSNVEGLPQTTDVEDKVTLSIMIKWSSMGDVDGRTKVKVNRLSLKELENIDKLGEKKWR